MTRIDDVDLFAGPGGWDEGVRALGIAPLGFEIKPTACATATKAGHRRVQADIASLDPRMATRGTRVRLLIASPPCQGFSMAGKGHGRRDSELLIDTVGRVRTRDDLELALLELHATMSDDRSLLVLEPLRWALALTPDFLAFEQVPAVLPIWQACATVLEAAGYSVDTGVLSAEQYGVPQTRKRAILVARSARQTEKLAPALLPAPTRSRYYPTNPTKLDPGLPRWVSMAEALGWGMTERPSMTVTGGGSSTGGAEPFGNAARQGMAREHDAGRWTVRTGQRSQVSRDGELAPYERDVEHPAPTVTGNARAWRMCAAGATSPASAGTVPRDPFEAPSATITGKGTAAWVGTRQRSNYSTGSSDGRTAAERGRTMRDADQPSVAVTGKGFQWEDADAATRRVTVAECAVLQSFPADYPWQGNKGEQYQQVGDAVPPLLARAVVAAVMGLPLAVQAAA